MADGDYGVQFVGPFPGKYKVIVEGRAIPKLDADISVDGSRVALTLDGRFGIDGTREEVQKWCWFVATALAIGQGYSHLAAPNKDQPFAPEALAIETPAGNQHLRLVPDESISGLMGEIHALTKAIKDDKP